LLSIPISFPASVYFFGPDQAVRKRIGFIFDLKKMYERSRKEKGLDEQILLTQASKIKVA